MAATNPQKQFYDEIWPHASTLSRVALILTRDPAEADDLAQETLLKAFKFIDTLRPDSDVKKWLLTILRNTRIDRARATSAHPAKSLDDIESDPPDTSTADLSQWQSLSESPQIILEQFSDSDVIQSLQQLPEEIRWTLLLVDVEGLDQHEAAELLRVPVGTIKSRTHRGRRMLRQTLLPLARQQRLTAE